MSLDRHRFNELFAHLVGNAREAGAEAPGRPVRINITARAAGGQSVRITVADNGVGIEAEQLKLVFRSGYTSKAGRLGFGLHSAANTIIGLGGSIGVDSAGADCGASFGIELPCESLENEAESAT